MKKIILLLAAAVLAAPVTFAQKLSVTNINREKTYKTSTHTVDIWYEGELNVGFATGGKLKWDDGGEKDKTNYSRPFISTVHGVRITKYGFVGLGAGVQYAFGRIYKDNPESDNWKTVMIPVFLNLKGYYPVNDNFAPYISVSLGSGICAASSQNDSGSEHGYSWESKLKGGFYGEYGVGFNYKRLNFGLGIQHQGMKFTYTEDGDSGEEKVSINSFYVKFGLKF